MCKPNNGTIYAECRDAAFKAFRRQHVTNRELRGLIAKFNGCMTPKVDRTEEAVVASSRGVVQ
jgi:hypothetical protein